MCFKNITGSTAILWINWKTAYLKRNLKPLEFIIWWNTNSGIPFCSHLVEKLVYWVPPWHHLWLKLLLSKAPITSPTLIKCFKPWDTNSSSVITVSMYPCPNCPLALRGAGESKGRPWAEALSQHSACKTSQASPPACRKTGNQHSSRCHQSTEAEKKLSRQYRTRFKNPLAPHWLPLTLNGISVHRKNGKPWRN